MSPLELRDGVLRAIANFLQTNDSGDLELHNSTWEWLQRNLSAIQKVVALNATALAVLTDLCKNSSTDLDAAKYLLYVATQSDWQAVLKPSCHICGFYRAMTSAFRAVFQFKTVFDGWLQGARTFSYASVKAQARHIKRTAWSVELWSGVVQNLTIERVGLSVADGAKTLLDYMNKSTNVEWDTVLMLIDVYAQRLEIFFNVVREELHDEYYQLEHADEGEAGVSPESAGLTNVEEGRDA